MDIGKTMGEQANISKSGSKLIFYLIILLAIPGILYIPPFFVVRLPAYSKWSCAADFPLLDYAFNNPVKNADVVIFGDSTAKVGIDPSQMEAVLGEKVLDLPNNFGAVLVLNDLSLRLYMEHNKPPKLIVFYFPPWNLDYGHDDLSIDPIYDGMEMLFRHGTSREIFTFFEGHPFESIQFPWMFYKENISANLFKRENFRKEAQQVAMTNGHADYIGATLRYNSLCTIPPRLIGRIKYDWVRGLAEKYSTPETKVMVYLAPIPACRNAQAVVDRTQKVTELQPSKIMPANLFMDDKYYVHLDASGVREATEQLIEAVRPLLDNPKR